MEQFIELTDWYTGESLFVAPDEVRVIEPCPTRGSEPTMRTQIFGGESGCRVWMVKETTEEVRAALADARPEANDAD